MFNGLKYLGFQIFIVDQLQGFFIDQMLHGILDAHLALLGFATAEILKHTLQLLGHLFHARRCHDFHTGSLHADIDFDFLVVKITFTQFFAKFLTGAAFLGFNNIKAGAFGRWQQYVENTFLCSIFSAVTYPLHFTFTGFF